MPKTPIDFRLYLISDSKLCVHSSLSQVVDESVRAGVRAFQIREKHLSGHDLFDLVQRIRRISDKGPAKLIINDRVDLAAILDVAGVQLTQKSLPAAKARTILGEQRLVGVSTHSLAEAQEAEREGADFLLLGPVFDTPAKREFGPPQGLEKLQHVCAEVRIPVFAVGGITPHRTSKCLQAGAHGVAVISAIMTSRDIAGTIQRFRAVLPSL